jgi:hypothetical protein
MTYFNVDYLCVNYYNVMVYKIYKDLNVDITVNAIYDGKGTIILKEQIPIAPNTAIKVQILEETTRENDNKSFLKTAASLNLDGPSDWSDNFENYLYGQVDDSGK